MDITRSVTISLVLLFTMQATHPERTIGPDASLSAAIDEPAVWLEDGSVSQRLMVEWAVDRYESAGLSLPPMAIRFDETKGRCEGHLGLTRDTVDRITVELCSGGGGSVRDRLVVVHELAHAWIVDNVDQATRDRLMDLHDLSTWWDADQDWRRQGVEWAAETIAWAVADEGIRLIEEVTADPTALQAGYQILTGLPATQPVLDNSVAERAVALEDRISEGRSPLPLQVAGQSRWSLDEFTDRWTQIAPVPWRPGPWTRPQGGAVATSALTPTVGFIAITNTENQIDSITLVAGPGNRLDTHDLVLAWSTLTQMFWPTQPAGSFDQALGHIRDEIRGIVHLDT